MDRSWMQANRLTQQYEDGVDEFIRFAVEHAKGKNLIPCPCWRCLNKMGVTVEELKDHLIINGIDKKYICWTKHGETRCETRGETSFDHLESNLRYAGTLNIYMASSTSSNMERGSQHPTSEEKKKEDVWNNQNEGGCKSKEVRNKTSGTGHTKESIASPVKKTFDSAS